MRHVLPILLIAFALRVNGTWTDLPFVYHWDEPTPVNLAVWLHAERSLDPRFFHYPGGLIYLLAGEFSLVRGLGQLFGVFADSNASLAWLTQGTPPRPPGGGIAYTFPAVGVPLLYLIGRIGNVVLGTLSVFWVYRLMRACGRVTWARPTKNAASPMLVVAALVPAFLLAFSPLHAEHSALLTTDAPCAAFLTWFVAELVSFRSPWRAGLALGLAAAFKYTGGIGLYFAPLGLLWIWVMRNRGVPLPSAGEWTRFWMRAVPIALVTFLVLNPFVLLSPREFLADFLYEARHMREGTGHFGSDLGAGASGFAIVVRTLWTGLGVMLLLGFAWALIEVCLGIAKPKDRSSRGATLHDGEGANAWIPLLAAWAVLYLVQLSTWRTVYDRYLVPIWPVLIVVAAWGGQRGLQRLRPLRPPTLAPANQWKVGMVAAVVLALPILPSLIRSIYGRVTPDPRTDLSLWISREIDPRETIVVEPNGPQIDAKQRALVRTDLLARRTAEEYRAEGARFLVSTGRERFLPEAVADSMRTRRQALMREGRIAWQRGSYWVLDLGPIQTDWALVQSALDAGRFAEAEAAVAAMMQRDLSDGRAWHLLGDARSGLGHPDSAAVAYTRAAQLRPKDPAPLYALGNLALRKSDWSAAVAAFQSALERAPGDPVAPLNLSTALMEEARSLVEDGRREEARPRVESALQYARAASQLAAQDAEIASQELRIRRLAERWGLFPQ